MNEIVRLGRGGYECYKKTNIEKNIIYRLQGMLLNNIFLSLFGGHAVCF